MAHSIEDINLELDMTVEGFDMYQASLELVVTSEEYGQFVADNIGVEYEGFLTAEAGFFEKMKHGVSRFIQKFLTLLSKWRNKWFRKNMLDKVKMPYVRGLVEHGKLANITIEATDAEISKFGVLTEDGVFHRTLGDNKFKQYIVSVVGNMETNTKDMVETMYSKSKTEVEALNKSITDENYVEVQKKIKENLQNVRREMSDSMNVMSTLVNLEEKILDAKDTEPTPNPTEVKSTLGNAVEARDKDSVDIVKKLLKASPKEFIQLYISTAGMFFVSEEASKELKKEVDKHPVLRFVKGDYSHIENGRSDLSTAEFGNSAVIRKAKLATLTHISSVINNPKSFFESFYVNEGRLDETQKQHIELLKRKYITKSFKGKLYFLNRFVGGEVGFKYKETVKVENTDEPQVLSAIGLSVRKLLDAKPSEFTSIAITIGGSLTLTEYDKKELSGDIEAHPILDFHKGTTLVVNVRQANPDGFTFGKKLYSKAIDANIPTIVKHNNSPSGFDVVHSMSIEAYGKLRIPTVSTMNSICIVRKVVDKILFISKFYTKLNKMPDISPRAVSLSSDMEKNNRHLVEAVLSSTPDNIEKHLLAFRRESISLREKAYSSIKSKLDSSPYLEMSAVNGNADERVYDIAIKSSKFHGLTSFDVSKTLKLTAREAVDWAGGRVLWDKDIISVDSVGKDIGKAMAYLTGLTEALPSKDGNAQCFARYYDRRISSVPKPILEEAIKQPDPIHEGLSVSDSQAILSDILSPTKNKRRLGATYKLNFTAKHEAVTANAKLRQQLYVKTSDVTDATSVTVTSYSLMDKLKSIKNRGMVNIEPVRKLILGTQPDTFMGRTTRKTYDSLPEPLQTALGFKFGVSLSNDDVLFLRRGPANLNSEEHTKLAKEVTKWEASLTAKDSTAKDEPVSEEAPKEEKKIVYNKSTFPNKPVSMGGLIKYIDYDYYMANAPALRGKQSLALKYSLLPAYADTINKLFHTVREGDWNFYTPVSEATAKAVFKSMGYPKEPSKKVEPEVTEPKGEGIEVVEPEESGILEDVSEESEEGFTDKTYPATAVRLPKLREYLEPSYFAKHAPSLQGKKSIKVMGFIPEDDINKLSKIFEIAKGKDGGKAKSWTYFTPR